ncbi:MAG: succinyl-diaminopimelate desuccinylase [Legionellales bacterium]|nr:succinyl-diaminopimelate desuccinylase [Legionellales bacterium]
MGTQSIQEILEHLIAFESVTPLDAGCQKFMISFLENLGFNCLSLNHPPVSNFFAKKGVEGPLLMFAGHTDVVPVGDISSWQSPPFQLYARDGMLYGRGCADMKGSLAAMLMATQRFIKTYPHFKGSLGFLITSGEEGDDFHLGTPYVMEQLHLRDIHPQFCVVGEPSSQQSVGDVIKIGRRGSLTVTFDLQGKQGHVAYPHLAQNPIHLIQAALLELTTKVWDNGNEHFPPTSLQITSIHSGGEAGNIIPGQLKGQFNIRYSTEHTDITLKQAIQACFDRHHLNPTIHWRLNGEPFLTSQGRLLSSCIEAIVEVTQQTPTRSTSGGTSDGRFIAPYGVEVIELGPVNASIHQVDECVSLADLEQLAKMYFVICEKLLTE